MICPIMSRPIVIIEKKRGGFGGPKPDLHRVECQGSKCALWIGNNLGYCGLIAGERKPTHSDPQDRENWSIPRNPE